MNQILDQLGSTITVVIANQDQWWDNIAARAQVDTCVIAVLPELNIGDFVKAIRSGADGAVWEDTPTTHLAAVVQAALRNDVLLPQPVLNAIITGQTDPDPEGLDMADIVILRHLAVGTSISKIADITYINKRTLQRRVTSICLRLNANNPAHAIHIATKNNYI